jgi:hypothetical protein
MDLSLPGAAASAASAIGAAVGAAAQAAGPVVAESMGQLGQMGQVVSPAVAGLDTTQLLAVAAALGWASGLRLYLVVFLTGLAGWLGWVPLPAGLQLLQNPLVLGTAGLMLFIEFFADKIPGLDSLWDLVHSVVRIPAGAALAAAVFGADAGAWTMVAALMGGTLAATSQAAKTTTRAAINTSPEPFSNIGASLVGDVAVPGMLWLSWTHPVGFFIALAIVLVVMVALIAVFWRFLRAVLRKLREVFSPAPTQG